MVLRLTRFVGPLASLLALGVSLAACQQQDGGDEIGGAAPPSTGAGASGGASNSAVQDGEEEGNAFASLPSGTKITVQGRVEVNEVDFEDGRHERVVFVVDEATGQRVEIKVPKGKRHKEELSTGDIAEATGLLEGTVEAALAIASGEDVVVTSAATVEAAATMRKTLVLVVDFNDGASSCGEAAIGGTLFTNEKNVDAWFQETSGGLLGFDGDADRNGAPDVRRVKINRSVSETCDYSGFASAADTAATNDGVTLSNYQNKIYVIPSTVSACGWSGLGNLSCGSSCRAWIKSCQYADIYAHELGHNLGMRHASTDADNDNVTDSEYGDYSDLMGIGGIGYRHVNAPHKAQMGWFPAAKVVSVSTGAFRIAPVEVSPSATSEVQTLKIAKPSVPGTSYYVGYRRALGSYSSNLSSSYANRISIHTYAAGAPTRLVTTLGAGEVFTDADNGVTMTVSGLDETGANVEVTTTCGARAPAVTFGAASASKAGGSGAATVTIANRDSAACGSSTFSLASAVPSEWSSALAQPSITLSPGQTGTVTMSVMAAAGAADGTYPISLSTSGASAAHAASGSGSHLVDNTPPSAVSNLTASSSQGKVTLTWGVPSDGSGSGVARYRVLRGGVEIGLSTSTSFADASTVADATYAYAVLAEDRAGNVSGASNTVSVTVTTRKGGKRR